MLNYVVRVRDLVHGFVHLTEHEVAVINHPLFQRLRHIRQNDVAFYVYPSLNISRFEHSLGCAHVAGKMAENICRSADFLAYKRALGLRPSDFVQVCRLYALLHDVGHLPLSHLFETAFEDYVFATGDSKLQERCGEWFGGDGFGKLHEACGAAIAPEILKTTKLAVPVRDSVLRLMANKSLAPTDILRPIKLLVDSEIDADRVDATARDGFLAGREYGNYDIERLCSAVFVQHREPRWRLAYSHKALGSIEGLLLDRCRTHTWIHFHHRVVAMKVAAGYLIAKLLERGEITKADFPVTNHDLMAQRDDVWLWNRVRQFAGEVYRQGSAEGALKACCDSILYRKSESVVLLWKNRTEYREVTAPLISRLTKAALGGDLNPHSFAREFEQKLSRELGISSVVHWLRFKPVTHKPLTPLTDENGEEDRGHLRDNSSLVNGLEAVWKGEPNFYVVLLGTPPDSLEKLRGRWADVAFNWLQERST